MPKENRLPKKFFRNRGEINKTYYSQQRNFCMSSFFKKN